MSDIQISQFTLNEFGSLMSSNAPSEFRIGKVISVEGSTLTLGIPDGEGGLVSVSGVSYMSNFSPTANKNAWYKNINGSLLVFGQQA